MTILGDGRMDSPGHSAQYCTYTVMEYENKDILACEIINKRETAMKSTAMEKEGLKRCLQKLLDRGIIVQELCTDASISIASMIGKVLFHLEKEAIKKHTQWNNSKYFRLNLYFSVDQCWW